MKLELNKGELITLCLNGVNFVVSNDGFVATIRRDYKFEKTVIHSEQFGDELDDTHVGFAVGDLVQASTNEANDCFTAGEVGVVVDNANDSGDYSVDFTTTNRYKAKQGEHCLFAGHHELQPYVGYLRFEVGDHVRVVEPYSDGEPYRAGDTGVVVNTLIFESQTVIVKFNGSENEWPVYRSELEYAPPV